MQDMTGIIGVYALLVTRGMKTIDQVPEIIREKVQKRLEELNAIQ